MVKTDLTPLVVKAQAGDKAAMNELMNACYQTLFYYAYNTVKNQDLACDITQESSIEIMATLNKLQKPEAFLSWASRIVAHQCTRYYRSTKDEVELTEDSEGNTILDQLTDECRGHLPEQVQQDKEFKKIMWEMLDSLPAEQREALLLFYMEQLSVADIAKIQGKPAGTVKSRLYYARNSVISQVDAYEKKTGIRLHSIAPLPLLLYFLFRENMSQVVASSSGALETVWSSISAASGATGAAGAGAAAGVAGTSAAGAAGTAGAAAAGTGIAAKIIAGIAAVAVTVGLVAGGIAISNSGNDTSDPGISNSGQQDSWNDSQETEPPTMPPAPEQPLEQMAHSAAYENLVDVTEQVNAFVTGIPSTKAPAGTSVTEFFTVDALQGYVDTYYDVGYTGNTSVQLDSTGLRMVVCSLTELPGSQNRYFFLESPDYSRYLTPKIEKIVYDRDSQSLYVMLDYYLITYSEKEGSDRYRDEVINNTNGAYYVAGINYDAGFSEPVSHIAFVSPKERVMTRTDLNVSLVSYSDAYMNYTPYSLPLNGVDINTYSFPSTKASTGNSVTLITGPESFMALQNEYNDIIDREKDTLIFEPRFIEHSHRTNGLQNVSTNDLLNVLISSPELDPQLSIRAGGIIYNEPPVFSHVCHAFYDAETQTAYLYIEYNGMPHTQYESFRDEDAIVANSKATYVMASIDFHDDAVNAVKNIVIVLPDPATA